ncbi:MAG: DesA family fatty acid desaturase [Acidiferrobacterales bacterium]
MFQGLILLPWWGYAIVALVLTHVTIASVTIFLHRHQAHRALDLHPIASHFFRFWLWLTTSMVTKEWAAIHRKHHAKVETPEDPHSPQQYGIHRILWLGASLYHREKRNAETLARYGHGTPDDWLERNIYTKRHDLGLYVMLAIDILLFGIPAGFLIWVVQMAWIPFWAAGVINGIGHFWGYRNFEVVDASTNIFPWGILIGGEELHNNHHAFASSAKLSSKWWEFDIGWMYIRLLQAMGLAHARKTPPVLAFDASKENIDLDTVRAVITNRFNVMAQFAREVMRTVYREELRNANPADRESWALLKRARRLMIREACLLDPGSGERLQRVLARYQALHTVYTMKQKLQDIWRRSATTQDYLLHALQDWCREAEETRIQALHAFARKLRGCTLPQATV